jgi:hypothetical protein
MVPVAASVASVHFLGGAATRPLRGGECAGRKILPKKTRKLGLVTQETKDRNEIGNIL